MVQEIRAQTNSVFYYSNILYSQLLNIRIFLFSIDMDEINNPAAVQDVSLIQFKINMIRSLMS